METKFLLPDIKEDLTTSESSGTWFNFNENFKKLDTLININRPATNISSIPSPWAQLILFRDALDKNHPLHEQVLSEILDLLEIIFFQESLSLNLSVVPYNLHEKDNNFTQILNKLNLHDETDDKFLRGLKYLVAIDPNNNDRTYLLGGLSPYSIFFIPKDKPKSVSRYFNKVTPYHQRPQLFQNYLVKLTSKITSIANINNSMNKLLEVFSNISEKIKNSDVYDKLFQDKVNNNCKVFDEFFGIELDSYLYEYIESPLKIVPDKEVQENPIVIKADYSGVFYNNYNITFPTDLSELKSKTRAILPGEIVRYPWLVPEYDFLEDKLVSLPYKFNDDVLILGDNKVINKNYLLPIKSDFFKYFSINGIDKYFQIQELGNNLIEVRLSIPISGNDTLIIKKVYTGKDIIAIEEPESVPLFMIWPNLHPDLWNHPYYMASFYSNSKNKADCKIKFFDYNGNNMKDFSSAEKSNSQINYKFKKLPTIIEIQKEGYSGLFLIDVDALNKPSTHESSVVGIDFGTSNTNIAYKVGNEGETELLKISNDSEHNLYSFNYKDFIILNEAKYGNDQDNFDAKIDKFALSLKFFFQPQFLGEVFDLNNNYAQIPFSSLISFDSSLEDTEALINANIPIYLVFGEKQEIQSDLKWKADDKSRQLAKLFIEQILLLVKYFLIRKGVDVTKTKLIWAYPKSFSKDQLDHLTISWDSFMKQTRYFQAENLDKKDESQAGLYFFINKHNLSDVHDQNSICIDVGGGTSDISINYKNENLLFASTFFGGNDLIGWGSENSNSILLDFIQAKATKRELRKAFSEVNLSSSTFVRVFKKNHIKFNYIIKHLKSDYLNDVFQEDTFSEKLVILYFYSILFYQVGIFLNNLVVNNEDKISDKLAFYFGGNGSRFLDWLEYGSWESNSNTAQFFKRILNHATPKIDLSEIDIIKSSEPKSEVAIGLCYSTDENYSFIDSNNNLDQILGEDILYKGKSYSSDDEIQNVFGNGANIEDTDKIDYKTIELSNDDPELIKFHKLFFSELKQSSIIDFTNEDRNEIFRGLQTQLTNKRELNGYIRDNLRKIYFANKGAINTSLFILGAKGCLNELINTLMKQK